MGIFDDAIREHLELKRHAGADEDELKELEDEAFGPPARPGEPDFPDTSEEAAVESDSPAAAESDTPMSGGVFDAETDEAETPDDAVIEAPADDAPALTPLDEAAPPETDEASAVGTAGAGTGSDAAEADEPTPDEVPVPSNAAMPPANEVEDQPPSFTTSEREAIADQPTVFFEQQPPAEMELGDPELDVDEETEEVGGAAPEPSPADDEPLIVEEAFSEPAAETEVVEPPHETEPEPGSEAESEESSESSEPATGDDDVLEETPEFLRDNPDDDELWFEQGEPKDFDF